MLSTLTCAWCVCVCITRVQSSAVCEKIVCEIALTCSLTAWKTYDHQSCTYKCKTPKTVHMRVIVRRWGCDWYYAWRTRGSRGRQKSFTFWVWNMLHTFLILLPSFSWLALFKLLIYFHPALYEDPRRSFPRFSEQERWETGGKVYEREKMCRFCCLSAFAASARIVIACESEHCVEHKTKGETLLACIWCWGYTGRLHI